MKMNTPDKRCLNVTNTFQHTWSFDPDLIMQDIEQDPNWNWQTIDWGRWGLPDITGVHCYTDDWRFENIWRNPENSLKMTMDKKCVISPDYSIFPHFNHTAIHWQLFRCWQIAGFWQELGVPVVYSINWTTPEQIERNSEFYPKARIIAVRCAGRSYEKAWLAGAEKVNDLMAPELVLHFGTKRGLDVWGENGVQVQLRGGRGL